MRLSGRSEYTIITISDSAVSLARFRKVGNKYRIAAFSSKGIIDGDKGKTLREVLKDAGGVRGSVILSGSLPDGNFFQCPAVDLPGIREQRQALEFELSKELLHVPEDPVIQYVSSGSLDSDAVWNVYCFPRSAFRSVAAVLQSCRLKADEFIYPLLGIRETDEDVPCPALERNYVYSSGQWRSASDSDFELSAYWRGEFDKLFIFPEKDFVTMDYMESLLIMRLIMASDFRKTERSVRILPSKFRPKRLRLHATLSVILFLILLGVNMKDYAAGRIKIAKEYKSLQQERNNYRRKNKTLKANLKKRDKEMRDLQRILALQPGVSDLSGCFAELSEVLPPNVMVSSLRFSETTVDLVLQTEAENVNLPLVLKRLSYWKVAQLNQRNMNGTVNMITLRLQRVEAGK